jgi:hypothetical protein
LERHAILCSHIDYKNSKKDPADGLADEKVDAIDELPVYSLNKSRPESLTWNRFCLSHIR